MTGSSIGVGLAAAARVQRFGDEYAWCVMSDDGATADECTYRYELGRVWAPSRGLVVFCMLNPSRATHQTPDLTITKCAGFTRRWEMGGFLVVNMFGLRSTDPLALTKVSDPVGPYNDIYIAKAIRESSHKHVIAAWGGPPTKDPMFLDRFMAVERMYSPWQCLGVTTTGKPKHPSRLGYDAPLVDLIETRLKVMR